MQLWWYDLKDGMILNVNEGFVSMFGYTKEEAINKRCSGYRVI